ncbi:MAG: transglycosylase SLT domain-containing protein [Terriglobia bacterium]
MGRAKLLVVLAAAITLVSCETAQQKKPLVKVPNAAFAPTPLPLRSPTHLVRKLVPSNAVAAHMAAISAIIDQAESAYTAGLNDYQSGNLEKSKQEFDQALSVLLESKYSLLNDDRLDQEFNVLADNINNVELAAIKGGNSLSQHQYVPTPIESFAGLTFPANPNVERQVEEEMRSIHSDVPLVSNQAVSGALAYLQSHARGYVDSVLERIGKYRPMISEVLRQQGLPQDLMYLPGPESGFNPHATSRKGAKGLWQLMSSTAALYGLKENAWVDEREDPLESTEVAAKDLKSLYKMFGDWYLALAAYDTGPGNVQRAIQRTGYADYWTLRKLHVLVPETENYVPIYLATALIAKDPQAYGFNVKPDAPLHVDHVPVSAPTDLRLVAGLIDVPVSELVELNPALRGMVTPEGDPGFLLNLPAGTGSTFELRIAAVPASDRLGWRAHRVEGMETLESVAREYHVTTLALANANHIETGASLEDGTHLLIPLRQVRFAVAREGRVRWVRRRYYYRVRRGDNLDLIADRFDVTTYQIRRWNHLRGSRLGRGRRLLVYRLVPIRERRGRPRHPLASNRVTHRRVLDARSANTPRSARAALTDPPPAH